jgi:membrane associated rhomboid family serine protease
MLLPIRTNIRPWHTPYANYAIIIINVVIFFASLTGPHREIVNGQVVETNLRAWVNFFMLDGSRPYIWQFVSYAFLHGRLMHILGNMYFLYLFGNNVNDKLGHLGYVCFYLAGAVFSGIGHCLMSENPVLGASGAVAAVTGAYLVLFPQTLITIIYWFIFIGTMELPALYFIAFKMIILDNVIVRMTPNVAYDAHLAGYAFGIIAMLIMLSTGLLSGSHYDLWAMIKRWNQRRVYRDVVSSGYDPFTGFNAVKSVKAKQVKQTAAQIKQQEHIQQLRTLIINRIGERNLPAAAEAYLELIDIDQSQVLPQQQMLDIANQLASSNRYNEAAEAYEKFLRCFKNYEYIEQVQLMLGIIYSRYLDRAEEALNILKQALDRLSDESQKQMCQAEITRLEK